MLSNSLRESVDLFEQPYFMFRLEYRPPRDLGRNKEMRGTYCASSVWCSIPLGRFLLLLSKTNSEGRTKSPRKVHFLYHKIFSS